MKKSIPHVTAVVVFLLITLAYFSPALDGKRIDQHDILQANGAAKEVADYREATGEEALWTNSMFGGMPAYQISSYYPNNWTMYLQSLLSLGIPSPAYMIFTALLGFYVMLLCFGVNPWLSIAGAIAYGLSTYFLIIIGAGHNTKMRALAYMPPIVGGLYLAYYRRKIWLGLVVTCLALALQIRANHFQITYYTAIIVLIFMIFESVRVIRCRQYANFVKASAAMIVAVVLAVGVNITNLLLTAEYAPYSTRGQSELTGDQEDKTTGLDKSYILNDYSYGVSETMDLFIPYFAGGPISADAARKSTLYDVLIKNGTPRNEALLYARQLTYWGGQDRGTAGPVYIGAVMVFLFVLGLFVIKGPVKWWLVTATVLSVLLAWGKHFYFFSDWFINYFPLYNKFRTVSMILVIAEFTIPLLGILAVNELLGGRCTVLEKQKAIKYSFFITGGIALFFMLLPGAFFNFEAASDANYPGWLIAALQDTRKAVMRGDSFRSLFFVAASAAVLWFSVRGKLKFAPACALLAALILVDLWAVDKRYLSSDKFVRAKDANTIQPAPVDLTILQDKSLNYRVMNTSVSTFNDATTSFFHKSVGGYHGAKMKRYQELIEHQISNNNMNVLNMLNTKYFIVTGNQNQPMPVPNPEALGNAWPVSAIRWVDNADEEIAALTDFDPSKEAVVDVRFKPLIEGFTATYDSTAAIELTGYEPNHLVYQYRSAEPQLVVFSEIFYDRGWNAFIDDVLAPHIRSNYVLRAMVVPAGTHKVEFSFRPESYFRGEKIALVFSVAICLVVLGAIGIEWYNRKKDAA